MPFTVPVSGFANGLAHQIPLNANYDIIWSFKYSLSGNNESQGGFATFLFDGNVSDLQGGGVGKSLNYASTNDYEVGGSPTSLSGVSGAILGIGFDSTGYFATSGHSLVTGRVNPIPDHLVVRGGQSTGFEFLTAVALSSIDPSFILLTSTEVFKYLRFRLSDVGQTLYVDKLDINNDYNNIFKYDVNLSPITTTTYKVGISYASPINGAGNAYFKIKNFHIEGIQSIPNTVSNTVPSISTYPNEAIPDPTVPDAISTSNELVAIPDRPDTVVTSTTAVITPLTDECDTDYTAYSELSADSVVASISVSADVGDYTVAGPLPPPIYKDAVAWYSMSNVTWLSGGEGGVNKQRDYSGFDRHMQRELQAPPGQGGTQTGFTSPTTAFKSESQTGSYHNENKTGYYATTATTLGGNTIGASSIWNFREGPWAIGGWFWPIQNSASVRFAGLHTDDERLDSFWIHLSSDDTIRLLSRRFTGGSNDSGEIISTHTANRDSWNFIAVSYDHNTQLYDLKLNDNAVETTSGIRMPITQDGVRIGYTGTANDNDPEGYFDEWFVFKRALSADDYTFLFNASAGRSYWDMYSETRHTLLKRMVEWWQPQAESGVADSEADAEAFRGRHNGINLTYGSPRFGPAVAAGDTSVSEYAWEIDARWQASVRHSATFEVSQSTNFGNALNYGLMDSSFAFSTWIYPTQLPAVSVRNGIISMWKVYTSDASYALYHANDKVIWVVSEDGGGSNIKSITATDALTLSAWTHIYADYSKERGTISLGIDGASISTISGVSAVAANRSTGGNLTFTIGTMSDTTNDVHYQMAKTGTWARTLSGNERTALYAGGSGFDYDTFFYEGITARED